MSGIMFRMNGYVQDERYIAKEHMDVRRDYVQDERYFAKEHMDVRRDLVRHALRIFEFCLIGN